MATAEISEQTLATTVTLDSTISHEDSTDSERLDKAQVQFSRSVVSDSLRPHGLPHARLPCLITNSRSLLKLMCIELVMPSNHLILCRPLLLLPLSFPASGSLTVSRLFTSGESVLVDPCRLTSHILD